MTAKDITTTSTDDFAKNQKKAVIEMIKNNLNEVAIPEGLGFYIVKPNTKEARGRQEKKLCPFTIMIDGKEYLLCRA